MELDAGWATRAGLNVLKTKKKPLGLARIRHFYLPFSEFIIIITTTKAHYATHTSEQQTLVAAKQRSHN
jgi:hypothetical protein